MLLLFLSNNKCDIIKYEIYNEIFTSYGNKFQSSLCFKDMKIFGENIDLISSV